MYHPAGMPCTATRFREAANPPWCAALVVGSIALVNRRIRFPLIDIVREFMLHRAGKQLRHRYNQESSVNGTFPGTRARIADSAGIRQRAAPHCAARMLLDGLKRALPRTPRRHLTDDTVTGARRAPLQGSGTRTRCGADYRVALMCWARRGFHMAPVALMTAAAPASR